MSYEDLILEKEGHIAILTLNRPEKLNAFTLKMREELPLAIAEVEHDDEVRVLLLTGAGRAFCSGADVAAMGNRLAGKEAAPSRRSLLAPIGSFVLPVARLEKPVVAAINGAVAGIGLSLAMLCDIRVASSTARFIAAWVRRGLIPDGGATWLLPRIMGSARALELMYLGGTLDASEAERLGLVNKVVPPEELLLVARGVAESIAKGPPIAIGLLRRAVYRDIVRDLTAQLDFESNAQRVCLATEDHSEGVKAFQEKREPLFRGK